MNPCVSTQETSFLLRFTREKDVFQSWFWDFCAKKRGQRLIRYKKVGG
nr:MAG TPA: hypothetical protein [Caudoviricetes sp.]